MRDALVLIIALIAFTALAWYASSLRDNPNSPARTFERQQLAK